MSNKWSLKLLTPRICNVFIINMSFTISKTKYPLKFIKDTFIKHQKIYINFITFVEYYIEFINNKR